MRLISRSTTASRRAARVLHAKAGGHELMATFELRECRARELPTHHTSWPSAPARCICAQQSSRAAALAGPGGMFTHQVRERCSRMPMPMPPAAYRTQCMHLQFERTKKCCAPCVALTHAARRPPPPIPHPFCRQCPRAPRQRAAQGAHGRAALPRCWTSGAAA